MAFSTEQRADQVAQANAEKNRNKEEAKEILSTEAGVLQMASLAEEGGSMGRRIARELRQFEATGKVSNWLAGETIKAESKREVPSSVVDDFVRRGAVPSTFQVQPALPFGGLPQFVPTIPSEGGGGGTTPAHPWKITIRTIPESDPPEYEYAIESASRLFDGFGGDEVTVDGADGDFRNLEEGFYFIEVDFSDGGVDQAQIQIDEDIGDIVEISGDPQEQTKLRQQIGYVFFEEGVPKVRQNAWHNYTLFDICRNGVPIRATIAT